MAGGDRGAGRRTAVFPIPNSFPQEQEANRFSYAYFGHRTDKQIPMGRWTEGASLDGKGKFEPMVSEPLGGEPVLAPPRPTAARRSSR